MSTENHFTGFNAYRVEAYLDGHSLTRIVVVSKDKDYEMTAAQRRTYLLDQIREEAFEKFGEGSSPIVTYEKATQTVLHL